MPEISLARWHVRYRDALGELVFPWDSISSLWMLTGVLWSLIFPKIQ